MTVKGTGYTIIGLGEHDIDKRLIGRDFLIVDYLRTLRISIRVVTESITIR